MSNAPAHAVVAAPPLPDKLPLFSCAIARPLTRAFHGTTLDWHSLASKNLITKNYDGDVQSYLESYVFGQDSNGMTALDLTRWPGS